MITREEYIVAVRVKGPVVAGGEVCVDNTQEDDRSGSNHLWKGGWEGVVAVGGKEMLRWETAGFGRERKRKKVK